MYYLRYAHQLPYQPSYLHIISTTQPSIDAEQMPTANSTNLNVFDICYISRNGVYSRDTN